MAHQHQINTAGDADDADFKFVLALLSWCCATHPKGFEPLGAFLQRAEEIRRLNNIYGESHESD